jgi:hypothetical protein
MTDKQIKTLAKIVQLARDYAITASEIAKAMRAAK